MSKWLRWRWYWCCARLLARHAGARLLGGPLRLLERRLTPGRAGAPTRPPGRR